MGSKHSKGLKNALKRQQAAIEKKKVPPPVKKKKIQKSQILIPVSTEDTVLLVGEGDFSYAVALVENNYAKNIIATSFDKTLEEIILKYPHSSEKNYSQLQESGVECLFNVDGTNLQKTLGSHAGKVKQDATVVVFNFPHDGKGTKDKERNIQNHQKLMSDFFESCQNLLGHKKYKIAVSLFTGDPYDLWNIKILARAAGLSLQRSGTLFWDKFPEYHHRRTNSELSTTKPAELREARTYIFQN